MWTAKVCCWSLTGAVQLLVLWFSLTGGVSAADESLDKSQLELESKIAGLIQQLGAEQFASREKAQAELERLGLTAFDALHEAQSDEDIEIALRARYLVRAMRVNWSRDDDPVEVKRILRGYGEIQNDAERKNRMERLASLEDWRGAGALCRLVRFEPSDILSKRAALLLMNMSDPQEEAQRVAVSQMIRSTVGLSKRAGGQWLRTFVKTLESPEAALPDWEAITRDEQTAFADFPESKSNREIVRDLLRWRAELLLRLEHDEEAVAVMRRAIELLDETRKDLLDMVDWLMERKAWAVVADVAKQFPSSFHEDPLLLYRLAESQVQLGQRELAEETAARALKLATDDLQSHIITAVALQTRGMFEWAEREFRHVIDQGPANSEFNLKSRLLLSEMLHDIGRELSAAKVLQGVVDAMDKDPAALQWVQDYRDNPASIRSRLYYFYAQHFASTGDRKQQIEHLDLGIESDPTDADVLIAMYRIADADDAWRQRTQRLIADAASHFREEISNYNRQVEQSPNETQRAWAGRKLATENNQLAWLIGNTEGDYDEALRCSQRSLELVPDAAGYLDTLGRCYYAKGDFVNAVKSQSRAVELEPHSGQIRRQLELFQKALAESKPKPAEEKP
jgi:tetratricopeptide (TPR) repeat protein